MEILGFDRVELVVQGDQIENAAYGPRSALDPASIWHNVAYRTQKGALNFLSAFGSTSCVGSVGTGVASTDSSAGEEAPDAPGITSVRISRGSIRPDECAVGGRLYECAQCGVPYERSQMETRRESGTGPVRLVRSTDNSRQEKSVKGGEVRNTGTGGQTPTLVPKRCPRFCVTSGTQCGLC